MLCYRAVNLLLIIASVILSARSDFRTCQDCGGVSTARQTLLTSPNYPQAYPPVTCCRYLIRSPLHCPTEYHIQFLDFSLESSPNCANDFLAVGVDTDGGAGTLCGHIIGVRTFRTPDGILRLRFVTNDAIEDRGFRLLITRLPCEETMTSNITSERANIKTPVVTQLLPPFQSRPEASDLTKQTNNHQQDVFRSEQYLPPTQGYLPFNPSPALPPCRSVTPADHPPIPGNNYNPQDVNYPQQLPTTGSCCASNFRQPRFYLSSPEFPARTDASQPRDCFHYIEKSAPNVCRLRVVFRFFALGSADAHSGQCLSDFIEIDGERMCGCRTGFVYTTDWGLGAKAIRVKTNGRMSGIPSVGFLLDIIQETCAVMRYSRQVGGEFDPSKLIPHAIVETNTTTRTGIYLRELGDIELNSKLFLTPGNPCEFGFADLLRLSFDPLWVTRSRC